MRDLVTVTFIVAFVLIYVGLFVALVYGTFRRWVSEISKNGPHEGFLARLRAYWLLRDSRNAR